MPLLRYLEFGMLLFLEMNLKGGAFLSRICIFVANCKLLIRVL